MYPSNRLATAVAAGIALLGLTLAQPLLAREDHHHGKGDHHHGKEAHQHGHAELELAVEGSRLTGHLHGPMDNFLAFEHSAKTPDQRRQVEALQANLKNVSWLVTPAVAAGCAQSSVKVESKMFEDKPYKGHADIAVEFTMECQTPDALKSIDLTVFANTKRLKTLNVQWALPSGQGSAQATAKSPRLSF